jgi:feruloyl esterase
MLAAGILGTATGAFAQEAEGAPILPVVPCAQLAAAELGALDAVVTGASETTRERHGYCFVQGYISPQTQFEVLLPLTTWRGRYLQQGCGGFCGFVGVSLTDPSRTSGYQAPWPPLSNGEIVVAASNNGHFGADPIDAQWAEDDPRLRVAYGYGSEPALARTAKAIISAFYGREPSYSYFDGVSNGGRQALSIAQRYPAEFDGIIAGAPASNFAPLVGIAEAWMARANTDEAGRPILTSEKLPALHTAVMEACAGEQGAIVDPRACTFDPATIQCAEGTDGPDCLTAAQVKAARRLYRGATDAEGRNLFNGGQPYGSELAWNAWLVQPAEDQAPSDTIAAQLALGYHRAMANLEDGADVALSDIEFSAAAHDRLQEFGAVYNANDPDLTAFRDAGGKLILYHGWADEAIPPFSTVDYYRAVTEIMGGFEASQSFSRLYMIPGLYHCPCGSPVIGDPATEVQFLQELVEWVEQDQAPGVKELAVTAITMSPAPAALSVAPFDPSLPPPDNDGLNSGYDYVGRDSAYRPGSALWCEQKGLALTCSHERPAAQR